MNPKVLFAKIDQEDLKSVMEIETQAYTHPWSYRNMQDCLQEGCLALQMKEGNQVLAYAISKVVLDEAQLLNITVAPSFQNRGLGKQMLNEILNSAQSLGAKMMFLEVRVSNVFAIRLYEKAGFCQIGERKNYYPLTHVQREDALVMAKQIFS